MKRKLGLCRGYIGDIVVYLGILWYPNNGESNGKENGK